MNLGERERERERERSPKSANLNFLAGLFVIIECKLNIKFF